MKVMHFEDEDNISVLMRKILQVNIPNSEYVRVSSPYCAGLHISLENPDVLVCDYQFERDTMCVGLLEEVLKFKGPVYVLSSFSPSEIRRKMPELPSSVVVYTKAKMSKLVEDLKSKVKLTVGT